MYDDELMDDLARAKRKLDTSWKTATQQKINQHLNEYSQEWRKKKRLQFLSVLIDAEYFNLMVYQAMLESYLERNRVAEAYLTKSDIAEMSNRIDKLKLEIASVESEQENDWERKKSIAKNVPFECIYEFTRGMAICPFHADTNPSLSLMPGNRVWCHSCHKGWDTISFTMEYNNVGFNEAVNRLLNVTNETLL